MMAKYRIVLADDHVLFREGLKMILATMPDYELAGEAGDGLELLALLKRGCVPDAVVLDVSMPRLRGIEAIREIKSIHPALKVLVLTMHKDEDLLCEAFIAGADGYLLKDDVAKEFFAALDTILHEKIYISSLLDAELKGVWVKVFKEKKGIPEAALLSGREKEILKLIAEGASSKEVGEMLCISARTVDHHRAKIMEKLNLRGTAELTKYAVAKGLVS